MNCSRHNPHNSTELNCHISTKKFIQNVTHKPQPGLEEDKVPVARRYTVFTIYKGEKQSSVSKDGDNMESLREQSSADEVLGLVVAKDCNKLQKKDEKFVKHVDTTVSFKSGQALDVRLPENGPDIVHKGDRPVVMPTTPMWSTSGDLYGKMRRQLGRIETAIAGQSDDYFDDQLSREQSLEIVKDVMKIIIGSMNAYRLDMYCYSVLDQIYHSLPDERPRFEVWRLLTFDKLCETLPVSIIRLAESGFYFVKETNDILCFSCSLHRRNWKACEKAVELVHLRLSSNCLQVTLEGDKRNVPIHPKEVKASTDVSRPKADIAPATASAQPRATRNSPCAQTATGASTGNLAASVDTDASQDATVVSASSEPRRDVTAPQPRRDVTTSQPRSNVTAQHPERQNSAAATQNALPPNTRPTTTLQVAPDASTPRYPVQAQEAPDAFPQLPSTSSSAATRAAEGAIANCAGSSHGDDRGLAAEPWERALHDMQIALDMTRATNPEFAECITRLQTFSSWPRGDLPQPRHLAIAGFHYLGIADSVRCFYCGVTLKNWRGGDDTWETHVRFRFTCDFVRAVRGEAYVIATQIKLANGNTGTVPNAPNGSAVANPGTTSPSQRHAATNGGHDETAVPRTAASNTTNSPTTATSTADPTAHQQERRSSTTAENGIPASSRDFARSPVSSSSSSSSLASSGSQRGHGHSSEAMPFQSPSDKYVSATNHHQGEIMDVDGTGETEVTPMPVRTGPQALARSNNSAITAVVFGSSEQNYSQTFPPPRPSQSGPGSHAASGYRRQQPATTGNRPTNPANDMSRPAENDSRQRRAGDSTRISSQRQYCSHGDPTITTTASQQQRASETTSKSNTAETPARASSSEPQQQGRDSANAGRRSSTVNSEHPTARRSSNRTTTNNSSNDSRIVGDENERNRLEQLSETNRQLRQHRTCRMCGQRGVDTIFLPCGHLVTCESCAASTRDCCLCGERIVGTAHVFLD